MKLFVLLLSTCAMSLGAIIPSLDNRIIGGEETIIENQPYQAAILNEGLPECGGSIISEDTILTAAHCVHGYDDQHITVSVGSTDVYKGEVYKVAKVIEHEDYSKEEYYNDIAVLKLARPLTFSSKVQPIPLQPPGKPVPVGTVAIVTGWGSVLEGFPDYPDNLRMVDVAVISREDCQHSYNDLKKIITKNMLCAQTPGHDSCQGDSGGPLVAKGHLIGVVSWGAGCADASYPGVYADVSRLHEFITRHI